MQPPPSVEMNILQNVSSAVCSEKEKTRKMQQNVAKHKTKSYLQNMPIKGNRKNLPQQSYLFVDSDFEHNLSVRTPNHFQGNFGIAKSPTLSRRDNTESSTKKFEMYETKLNRSKDRSNDRNMRSKDKSRDKESKNL